jgi:acyl-CoA thioesterase-1
MRICYGLSISLLPLLLAACGADAQKATPKYLEPRVPVDAPLVAVLGDSLSAGIHLAEDEAFPAVVQTMLLEKGVTFRLVNAGVSGDTTAGGLRRIDWLLKQKPAIVIVELGGNDGLRGQPVDHMKRNLDGILKRIKAAGVEPLLIGMRIPTSYGEDYTEAFARVYEELAKEHDCAFVPFFMQDIAGKPDYFLEDALHPNEKGHALLAERLAPALEAMLR